VDDDYVYNDINHSHPLILVCRPDLRINPRPEILDLRIKRRPEILILLETVKLYKNQNFLVT
jgi:hypothetical protein